MTTYVGVLANTSLRLSTIQDFFSRHLTIRDKNFETTHDIERDMRLRYIDAFVAWLRCVAPLRCRRRVYDRDEWTTKSHGPFFLFQSAPRLDDKDEGAGGGTACAARGGGRLSSPSELLRSRSSVARRADECPARNWRRRWPSAVRRSVAEDLPEDLEAPRVGEEEAGAGDEREEDARREEEPKGN